MRGRGVEQRGVAVGRRLSFSGLCCGAGSIVLNGFGEYSFNRGSRMGTARAVLVVVLMVVKTEAEPSRDVPCSHRALAASG